MDRYQAYTIIMRVLDGDTTVTKEELDTAKDIYRKSMLIVRYTYAPNDRVITIYKPNKTSIVMNGLFSLLTDDWEYKIHTEYGIYREHELWSGNEIKKMLEHQPPT